jgi:hypothetical protein
MEIGTLCRLSNHNIYVATDYRGLTLVVLENQKFQPLKIPGCREIPSRNGIICFVVEKNEKTLFFDYQLSDAEVLCR